MPSVVGDLPDVRRRDVVAETGQFVVDAPVAPGRVVVCYLHYQHADTSGGRADVRDAGAGTASGA
jgi:hypothetical protein